MNGYARLSVVKNDLKLPSGTTEDAALLRAIEAASREFDQRSGRFFYSEVGTYYFDILRRNASRYVFRHPSDVLSVTTMAVDDNADGTYGLTLTANTDYILTSTRPGGSPYNAVDVAPQSTSLAVWPVGRRRLRLVGKVGYSDTTELTGATASEALDASETGIDISAALVDAGETIVIDSEQMYVSAALATAPYTLTVVRGINGTTAASHLTAAPVYRRRYPEIIEQAVAEQVVGFRWGIQTGNQGMQDSGNNSRVGFAKWRDAIRLYALPGVA